VAGVVGVLPNGIKPHHHSGGTAVQAVNGLLGMGGPATAAEMKRRCALVFFKFVVRVISTATDDAIQQDDASTPLGFSQWLPEGRVV
jgi:hypothetical protein